MKISSTFAPTAPLQAATLLRGELFDAIGRTADMGFDGIELQYNLSDKNKPDFHAIRKAVDERGIEVVAWGTGSLYVQNGLSLIDEDPDVVDETLRRLEMYVDGAVIAGGTVIIGCVRGNIDDATRFELLESRFAENLRRFLAVAKSKGVPVVVEAINRYENNYLPTAGDCVQFIKKYELDHLNILLDTFHMNIEEKDISTAIRTAGPLLGHFHAVDSNRNVPGSGMIDYQRMMTTLFEIGYDGWLSIESRVARDENAEAARGLHYLRTVVESVEAINSL